MFSWGKKEDPGQSKEVKEMEAMIAAMTSASLTSFSNEEEEEVDDEALLEAELAELTGIGNLPMNNQRMDTKYKDEDPENVQLETGDEDNPELLEELASLSPHSVDMPTNEPKEQIEGGTGDLVEASHVNAITTEDSDEGVTHEVLITPPKGMHIVAPGPVVPDEGKNVTSVGNDKEVPVVEEQKPVDKQIAAARMLALRYKRAGDLEAAKDVLKMMRQLENGQSVVASPAQKKPPMTDELVSAKPNHKVVISRQIAMERLQEQANKALRTSKLHELQKQPTLAQVFKQKTRTILSEIDKLKKSGESSVRVAEIPVSYDVVTPSIKDIKPDELCLGITQIKAEGFGDEACWSFQCTLDSQEKTTSIGTLTPKVYHDIIFVGLVRDLKLQKFFEHRKLRIELLKHEPGLFGSLLGRKGVGQPFGASAQIKLDSLLKEPSSIETVSFTCKNKRYTLQADISLKVNTPIGGKPMQRIKETWITLKVDQEEAVARKPSLPGTLPGAIPVEELVSYSVLEEELNKLASLPLQTKSHPAITTRQLQLESAKDLLALKVQIGELSQEDYAKSINEAIAKFRKQAIVAKKAGDLPLAKSYLAYSKVMERELADEGDVE